LLQACITEPFHKLADVPLFVRRRTRLRRRREAGPGRLVAPARSAWKCRRGRTARGHASGRDAKGFRWRQRSQPSHGPRECRRGCAPCCHKGGRDVQGFPLVPISTRPRAKNMLHIRAAISGVSPRKQPPQESPASPCVARTCEVKTAHMRLREAGAPEASNKKPSGCPGHGKDG
jgi:hypothetical protein